MHIEITDQAFDPYREVVRYQEQNQQYTGKYGATVVFVGTMRDLNEGDDVAEMFLEHYPGMTEKYLEKISQQAKQDYNLFDVMIIHRVGSIQPDESIVLVAVWSGHRKEAFEACREIMEDLKSKAPFWKKESLKDGEKRWVEHNTKGY